MNPVPRRAMVLAAGLGKRLRPLTEDRPKPLIEVAGKALIDHALDRLAEAGVERAVVNLHYKGELLRRHLSSRDRPRIVFSDESALLLETGGGVAHALDALGPEPFLVVNSDVLWLDGTANTLGALAQTWVDGTMDALLLLQPTGEAIGYDGAGDYGMDPTGRLSRRAVGEVSPFLFAGVQMLHPRLFDDVPEAPFSLNLLFDRAERAGRLFGLRHEGRWGHVGTPQGLAAVEAAFGGTVSRAP